MSARISQREARRLRKRVVELEYQEESRLRRWSSDWPMGVNIVSAKWEPNDSVPVSIRTARSLKHAVVVTCGDNGNVLFHAVPLLKVQP